jgi:hypothetical protein
MIVLITFCSNKNSKDSNKGGTEKKISVLKVKKAFQNSLKLCVNRVQERPEFPLFFNEDLPIQNLNDFQI